MSKYEWSSDYYKELHDVPDSCENCKYYAGFECTNEWSNYYEKSVDETNWCDYHWAV